MRISGGPRNSVQTIDIDNELWFKFNKAYASVKQTEYAAMKNVPELVKLRSLASKLRSTSEMAKVTSDWTDITQESEHQALVKEQAQLVKAYFEWLEFHGDQWKGKRAQITQDVLKVLNLYFLAVADGDLDPLFNYVIDGEYTTDQNRVPFDINDTFLV